MKRLPEIPDTHFEDAVNGDLTFNQSVVLDVLEATPNISANDALAAELKNNYGYAFPGMTDDDWRDEARRFAALVFALMGRSAIERA